MVKKILFIAAVLWNVQAFAQLDTRPPYLQFPTVPPFTIQLFPDSSSFTRHDLDKRKPLMIFLFSPDCDHCHHAMTDLLANILLFKKMQLVMVTSLDFKMIKEFYGTFKIADHPSIKVGRDPGYFLGSFYKNTSYPSLYFYNKKGKFIKGYESPGSFAKIAEEISK